MTELAPHQLETLQAIQGYQDRFGHPPTAKLLSQALGLSSTNGARDRLVLLRSEGLVVWGFDKVGTLRVTMRGREALANGGRLFKFLPVTLCKLCGRSSTFAICCDTRKAATDAR